ncbi:MAG: hypothetical protein RR272_02270 [Synergistaceae bacterium]
MMVPKEIKTKKKRIRRSPEILMKELDTKMKKLEERIYKKNKDIVHQIGVAILKKAEFDFATFKPEYLEDIKNMTPKGKELIKKIIEDASQD